VLSGSAYRFDGPYAIALDGVDVWVANYIGNSVSEFNGATGRSIRVLHSKRYRFSAPWAIASSGRALWVANYAGSTVTEINATTGALIRVADQGQRPLQRARCHGRRGERALGGQRERRLGHRAGYGIGSRGQGGRRTYLRLQSALRHHVRRRRHVRGQLQRQLRDGVQRVDGGADPGDSWGSRWPRESRCDHVRRHARLGRELQRELGNRARRRHRCADCLRTGATYGLRSPDAIAPVGSSIWVADAEGSSVTEIDQATGELVRIDRGSPDDLSEPDAIASNGTDVWIANFGDDSVTELSATTGMLVRSSGDPRTSSTDRGRSAQTGPTSGWRTTTPAP